jgi:hypothetical protein
MVKTHRLERSSGQYCCHICNQKASYWSQDEVKGGLARGAVVYHCQAHRDAARAVAADLSARINLRAEKQRVRRENPDLTPTYKTKRQGLLAWFGVG